MRSVRGSPARARDGLEQGFDPTNLFRLDQNIEPASRTPDGPALALGVAPGPRALEPPQWRESSSPTRATPSAAVTVAAAVVASHPNPERRPIAIPQPNSESAPRAIARRTPTPRS